MEKGVDNLGEIVATNRDSAYLAHAYLKKVITMRFTPRMLSQQGWLKILSADIFFVPSKSSKPCAIFHRYEPCSPVIFDLI